jgi:hypothetical protein
MGRNDADLRSALHAFLVLAFGGDPIWHLEDAGLDENDPIEESPLELVEKLTGANKLAIASRPLAGEVDQVAILTEIRDAGILDLQDPGRAFRTATQADLELARERLRAFEPLLDLARLIEYRFGRDTAGLGISSVHKRDAYFTIAWRLRFWRLAPQLFRDDELTALLTFSGMLKSAVKEQTDLIAAFPGYRRLFQPGAEQWLISLPVEEREEIAHRMHAYFEQQPWHARSLHQDEIK